ncbi:MAG: SIS domain-containing protein [Promethearchaeati archaeon SRVP18_Atabeyarchaeia-1]
MDVGRSAMLREIKEQPQTLRETIDSVAVQAETVSQVFDAKRKKNRSSIFLIGCGTSYHAAIAGKHALRVCAGIPSVAYPASEFRDFETRKTGDIIIAISQSGETGDVLTAVGQALEDGCSVLAVTNEKKSTLVGLSENAIVTKAGKEIAVPMTKTYTALLAGIFSLAEALRQNKAGASTLHRIPAVVEETIRTSEPKIKELAEQLKENRSAFIVGRGPSYATALEASLKLKEAALVHAEAFPSPEFRHGPKSMLEPGTSLIAFTNSDRSDDTTQRLLEDIRPTGATTISIGDKAGSTILIPPVARHLAPIPSIVPLQLLAAHIAAKKGINPDNPRNLTKVTTET